MTTKKRSDFLTTIELYNLDAACRLVKQAFGGSPYLVGSCAAGKSFRDVDVRLILDDGDFDAMFKDRPLAFWDLLCISIGGYLRQRTGLPLDFQIQRQSEANAKFDGTRNPLGMGRRYAAGGDGTPEWMSDR